MLCSGRGGFFILGELELVGEIHHGLLSVCKGTIGADSTQKHGFVRDSPGKATACAWLEDPCICVKEVLDP